MNSSPRIRSQRYQMIQTVLLSVYSLALFGMHFIRIFDNSFWGDESYTIQLVKMNFFRMCFTTAKDVHPPLYYFFTQILYFILGDHGYTYHLSAVIPYGILLLLACTVIRRWFGMIPAVVVITLSSLTSSALIYRCRSCTSFRASFLVRRSLQRAIYERHLHRQILHRCKGADFLYL